MKVVTSLLARAKFKTFKVSYSNEYKTFITHHVLNDQQHPLCHLRKRELEKRKQEGLWWHITTGLDLSKSGVVRSWCRRRLRNAFTDELKEKGFDEHGRLLDAEALKGPWQALGELLRERKDIGLTGGLRVHAQPLLVPAKYADVRKEASMMVEILLEGIRAEMLGAGHKGRAKPAQSQRNTPTNRVPLPPSTSSRRRTTRSQRNT